MAVVLHVCVYLIDCFRKKSDRYLIKNGLVKLYVARNEGFTKDQRVIYENYETTPFAHLEANPEIRDNLRYVEDIARGGFGTVHKALLLGQPVAVKHLHVEELPRDYDLLNEVICLVRGQSEFVLRFHSFHFADAKRETLCITTEYVPHGTLESLVEILLPGRLDDACAVYASGCVLEGIAFLHSRQVAHLDIKAQNIGLGRLGCPKILDFGCAVHDQNALRGHHGTFAYTVTPEMDDPEPYCPYQADHFAFAGMVFYLLKARSPFMMTSEERRFPCMDVIESVEIRLADCERTIETETIAMPAVHRDFFSSILKEASPLRSTRQ